MSLRRPIFGFGTIAIFVICAAAGLFLTDSYAAPAKESGAVLAKVETHAITEHDVDSKLKPQLAALQVQLYELRKNTIQSIADDYILKEEADKAHLKDADAYLKREIYDKIPEPSDQQVRAVYERFKSQIHRPYKDARAEIIGFIKSQEASQKKKDLLRKLREDHGLKIFMKAPRFEVEVAGHPSLGPDKAPITIVEFTDFQCPFCKRAQSAVEEIRAKYGDKVKLVHADFPLASIHQHAMAAALAARCANEQGKFWQYRDALFADQSKLEPADLKATASKLGLDTKKFDACYDSAKYAQEVQQDVSRGQMLGIDGTPAFFINGRPIFGARPFADFAEVIDEELAAQHQKVARK
jgi:predicted DsbA family dithiol-disulfide isomerase